MKTLKVLNFARIKKGSFEFGDLTVFVGPQATGKTLVLELIKLVEDRNTIMKNLKKHGFEWKNIDEFLSLYFGEGMSIVWNKGKTKVVRDGKEFVIEQKGKSSGSEKIFYIPAQRVLTLGEDGWPTFISYRTSYPYVVRKFSEEIRLLLERMGSSIFPIEGRMKSDLRNLLNESIFWNAELSRSTKEMKRRLTLKVKEADLPFMVWSAGQREFIPLLLGFYWLMPSGKTGKRKGVNTVIIEEPEMGLHPKALETVMILILELLRRRYKVIISTHSSQILEMIWAINIIKKAREGKALYLKNLFGIKSPYLDNIWESAVKKNYRVFYFKPDNEHIRVKDISSLDLFEDEEIAEWGGLTSFATRASDVVSDVISETEKIEEPEKRG